MTRKPETIAFWTGRLPHWEVVDGRYFVTIHLAGAILQAGQNRIRAATRELAYARSGTEHLQIQRKIFTEMENWLDRAPRSTYLSEPRVAEMVVEAIEHRAQQRVWNLFEYVVMPNHIHMFLEVLKHSLKESLEGFKDWMGHRAGKLLRLAGNRFWQKEWFDHWSRSDDEDERIVNYIRNNPVRAGLVSDFRTWKYGSWNRPVGPDRRAGPGA